MGVQRPLGATINPATMVTELMEIADYIAHVRDEGSRRVGELGIGCNPGITRYMRNTLFDEKIDGTVHIALGNGMPNPAERTVNPSAPGGTRVASS